MWNLLVDEVRKFPRARNPIGSCFKNGLHWANLIHPQENPLRHVLYHKLPLPRSILKFFFLRELPQLVFGPGQSGSQFGVHYDNLDPPTGSSWKGSQLNSGDPEHKTSYPWKLHDSIESKSMKIPPLSRGDSFLRIWAAQLQRSCRRSERSTHLIGGITSELSWSKLPRLGWPQPAPKGSYCWKYFQTSCLAHTSKSWDPGESWFSLVFYIYLCKRNIPPIFYLFFSRCSLFFSRLAAQPQSAGDLGEACFGSHHTLLPSTWTCYIKLFVIESLSQRFSWRNPDLHCRNYCRFQNCT